MLGEYLTITVEQAATIWFSKELLDINASIGSCRGAFFIERIRPKKITLKIRDVLAHDEWDPDPLPGEGKADTKADRTEIGSRSEHVASRKRKAEHRVREIREEAWLKLKNDLRSGKPQASAMPCRDNPRFSPKCPNPIDVTPSFWQREDLSESSLGKQYPFGISSRPHLVLISKEELKRYLHPEKLPTQVTFAGSKAEQNKDKVDGNDNDGNLVLTRAESVALNAKPRRRGGCKPKYDWDKIEAKTYELMDYNGDFSPADAWNAQARLVEALQDFYQKTFGPPSQATRL